MDYEIKQCLKHTDNRGYLVEFLRRDELEAVKQFGQIYFVTFERPMQVRGNHFHTRGREWFGVAHGDLECVLEDTRTKERVELFLSSDDKTFTRLMVGSYIAHAFRNTSPIAVLLDYCTEQYDKSDLDRHPYLLLPPTLVEAPAEASR